MKKITKHIRISILFVVVFGIIILNNCKKNKPKTKTVIIGKIVNPKKNQVVLSDDPFDIHSDTIMITDGNKLKGNIKVKKEGLYYLYIFPEFQVVYLKPGDSLAFIINTNEFDESLSFSGTSGFENNLLMDIFLMNEKENLTIRKNLKKLSPQELKKELDTFLHKKQKFIQSFKDEYKKTSKHYKSIINLYNQVTQSRLFESYAQNYKQKLPENFFEYRKILKNDLVDVNIPDLLYFAKYFIDNKLKQIGKDKSEEKIINLINNEIKNDKLKDIILTIYCKEYIYKHKIYNDNDTIIKKYEKSISQKCYIKNCNEIILKNKILKNGNLIPNIDIVEETGKINKLNNVVSNKTIISFWDYYFLKNFKSNIDKLNKIKQKYPEINIILLNVNTKNFDEWKIQMTKDTIFKNYQIKNKTDLEKIFTKKFSEIYLLKDNKIIDKINMYKNSFNEKLDTFINKK